jgi:hypothetical protein
VSQKILLNVVNYMSIAKVFCGELGICNPRIFQEMLRLAYDFHFTESKILVASNSIKVTTLSASTFEISFLFPVVGLISAS